MYNILTGTTDLANKAGEVECMLGNKIASMQNTTDPIKDKVQLAMVASYKEQLESLKVAQIAISKVIDGLRRLNTIGQELVTVAPPSSEEDEHIPGQK